MSHLLLKLWKDDAGIVALEYLLVATIIGLGLVVGLAAIESGLNAELSEGANAIMALSQGYAIGDQSCCGAFRQGSQAIDTPGTIRLHVVNPTPITSVPSTIDQFPCQP
jgi:Flp pilus assembly pilin Flp